MSTDLQTRGSTAVEQHREPQSLLEAVMREVSNPNTDPARLREFLEIGERLEARQAKAQFVSAMADLRPQLPIIKKNGLIKYGAGKGSSPFAKWDDIYKACMPLLDEHGFSCSFDSELQGGNALKVTMTVRHIAGHQETGSLIVPWLDNGGSKSPAQAAASSFTIAQRHTFVKYFNILTEDRDDDGTGKGVPDKITEAQAIKIDEICESCEEREAGFIGRFRKWVKAELRADKTSDLFQGEQFDLVMAKLREKMTALGVR